MVLLGLPVKGALDLFLVSASIHPEDLVVVTCHSYLSTS
jgi:hypothetical protein